MKYFNQFTYVLGTLLIILLLVIGNFNFACSSTKSNEFPHFKVTTLDGKELDSKKLTEGKVAIINFWATWCPPCREEIPHFIDLQKKYDDKVQFIGISVDRDPPEKVKQWTDKNKVNYPVARVEMNFQQPYQQLLPKEMRGGIPYTFILDKNGKIVERLVGYRDYEYWEKMIKRLSAN
ncbi:MAG: TlpA family protein disulfide reductase [bacterium]|nr:TlpA family protein disulfide reductase [bacterium]